MATSRTLGNEMVCRERPQTLRKDSQALLRYSSLDPVEMDSSQTSEFTHSPKEVSGDGGFVFKKPGPGRNIETD